MAETIFIKYYENTDCLHGYSVERTVELTRLDAIERMAKAEYRAEYGKPLESADELTKSVFLIKAEAALNSLLEGK